MSPKHWAEQRKSKPDFTKNLAGLEKIYGGLHHYTNDIGLLKSYDLPLNFHALIELEGDEINSIPFSPHARLKCQNCGLFNRGTLCPPRIGNTYPFLRTIKEAKEWLGGAQVVYIFVWQNDGTRPWKVDWNEILHIEFLKITGRRFKGVEHASAKALTKIMKKLEDDMNDVLAVNKTYSEAMALIPGHCDLCGRYCPLREYPDSKCKKGGMPSMEAIGIDVYKLLTMKSIDWCYPVGEFLTQVTMLVIHQV